MDIEEFRNAITCSITSEKIRGYLLMCFENEYRLNSNLSSLMAPGKMELIKKAMQRFENKIKACK